MKLVVVLLLAVALPACSDAYKDLESAFAVDKTASAPPLVTRSITITSQTRRGASSYRDLVTIRPTADAIDLEFGMPFMRPLSIPKGEIAGCSMTCFGMSDQYVDLLIPRTGTDLMIRSSKTLLDWCWTNEKPMISGKARRAWQYSRVPLPPASRYNAQFASRALFDKQTHLSCMGY